MSLTTRFETEQGGRVLKAQLAGSLDTNTSPGFDAALAAQLNSGIEFLVLDMKDLDYISSAGIRSVFKAAKSIKQLGGSTGVANRRPQIVKVFDIIKALPDLNVFATTAEMDEYLTLMQNRVKDAQG